MFRKQLEELKIKSDNYIKSEREYNSSYNCLSDAIQEKFMEYWNLGKTSPLISCEGLIPKVKLYGIIDNRVEVCITENDDFTLQVDGFSVQDVYKLIEKFQQDTGVTVKVCKERVVDKTYLEEHGIHDRKQLEIYYADRNIEVLEEGKIWYVGRDINDLYFLFRLDNKKEI